MSIPDKPPFEASRDGRSLPACIFALCLLAPVLPGPLSAAPESVDNNFKSFDPAQTRRLVPISAEAAAANPGLLPLKPASGIIDDLNVLSVKQRTAIARELIIAAVEANTHVYIVTLGAAPAASAEAFASDLLDSWRTSPTSGIVLYFAGNSDDWQDRFFIVPGSVAGKADLNAALSTAAMAARSKALEANAPGAAIESASLALLEELRGLPVALRTLDANDRSAQKATASPVSSAPHAAPRVPDLAGRKRQVVGAFVAAIVVAFAVFFIRRYLRNRIVMLPESEFRYRLCAPYSGGNCARLDFKERHQHTIGAQER